MHRSKQFRAPSRLAVAISTLAFCLCVQAQTRNFDIAAGDMKSALEAYAAQSGTQLIYKSEDVKGLSTKGVKRSVSPEEALQAILDGTPLKMRRDSAGAIVLFVGTPGPSAAETQTQELSAVLVSASRRREPARDVPMQVNVLGPEALQRTGAKSLGDYLTTQAGVDLSSEGGPGFGAISIRGVTTGTQTIPTVGVYVDDVAVGSSSAFARGSLLFLDMGLLDLNHIELLRGPQGTLYGASAMGGLLKYVTNVPDTHDLSGQVALTASTTKHGRASETASAVINVPIKDDFAGARLSVYRDHEGGWVDATGPAAGSGINRGDSTGARASVLVTPTRDLTIRLTGTLQDIKRDGFDFVDYDPKTSQPVAGELSRQLSVREPYRVKTQLYAADVEYDFGFARLNSITSHQKVSNTAVVDATSVYVPLLATAGLVLGTVDISTPVSFNRTSQEFRLTSKTDKQLEWIAGLYYDHESGSNVQLAETTLPAGTPGPQLANVNIPSTYKELAAFGDVTWKFTPALAVTGGLRIAHNKQDFAQNSSGALVGGAQSLTGESSDTSKTFLLTGRYSLDTASSVYARVASGYRPGGPNAVPLDINTHQPLASTTFKHDSLVSYEAGYKADVLGKVLSVEAAIYDIEWRNLQQHFVENGVGVITNAGNARVRGAELSATYRPMEAWLFTGNAAYTDAKLTQDAPGLGATSGQRLPDSARFTGSLQGNYSFTVLGRPTYAGLTYRFIGSRDAGIEGSSSLPSYKMPSYSLTDLQAGTDIDHFKVALFARNVFDKRAQTSAYTAFLPLGGNALVSVIQPRTFGVTLSTAF